ncbi:hypothetical protein PL246_09665 [Salmonella enterica]|uniref:hypothetical protein n=1 Tax=Salmonella enterica TaxID=28901 RepID=UPI00127608C2|nr:hypothetical protein [Salmonella enterica]ECC9827539.1 hypothetical protein [Salmonella enterica subsp. enterica]HBJ6598177.1 hypothetical protein [Salmonella enterica subsp. enterica serovar Havana]EHL7666627.1 hypothetical protein [Salmonella enterica]EHM8725010.1 hypothetical protein [Salmonella enterica]EKE5542572.1 hypothetical protein [Salmonella enterica]
MSSKGTNYQIIYRGQILEYYFPGQWVFFQRPKESGGGYWLGKMYDDCFWLELERPVSLFDGLRFMGGLDTVQKKAWEFDDDFQLEP